MQASDLLMLKLQTLDLWPSDQAGWSEVTKTVQVDVKPILATGFKWSSLDYIRNMFYWWDDKFGRPALTDWDESLRTPGLFLAGPQLRHQRGDAKFTFCFVYKYRARFAVVACAIADRLGKDARAD